MRTVTVVDPGPLSTLQDLGRSGYAHLGVPGSGGADRSSLTLANRLVGNPESTAVIETTLGGLRIRAHGTLVIAVTGARAEVRVDGSPVGNAAAVPLPDGAELTIDTPAWGCRNYVAVRGGFDVPAVLGSRSTDTLSGLGPEPLAADVELPVGRATAPWPAISAAPVDNGEPGVVSLETSDGPRREHVENAGNLAHGIWAVSPDSNRVGVRLDRPADSDDPLVVHRADAPELASEGVPHGGVQVPPSGRPVIFLADHPVTGGYPVIAVLTPSAVDQAAQLVAGQRIRFHRR
ncbi:biotin-dependent carboxyltransferase family protein [Gordonia hankookensis]|uniref:Biotin-dependent carboxyltransferase family protein n=1 Tax=Gordonia hankookensis TaxID=589403 RepID=A0ABR7WF31_9ACTN|nr:biotin-dependent carboxyltransferase family protein [Gordonia hankookensis]MBD1321395.1 biotin-dependent carboxyltransferase family protein [Gordonia hankookensis]